MSGQVGKAYAGPREALRLTGKFVLAQLLLASGGAEAAARTASLPFVTALEAEVRRSIPSTVSPVRHEHTRDEACVYGTPHSSKLASDFSALIPKIPIPVKLQV